MRTMPEEHVINTRNPILIFHAFKKKSNIDLNFVLEELGYTTLHPQLFSPEDY